MRGPTPIIFTRADKVHPKQLVYLNNRPFRRDDTYYNENYVRYEAVDPGIVYQLISPTTLLEEFFPTVSWARGEICK